MLRALPRILILEYGIASAPTLSDRVASLGYEVVATVHTAAAALDRACVLHPDAVLMDSGPDRVDGQAAAARIRSDLGIPTIFIASCGAPSAALSAAASSSLPLGPDDLPAALIAALASRRMPVRRERSRHRAGANRRTPVTAPTGPAALRAALAAGEFVLHYQPQSAVHLGTLRGVEALLRWEHPERGLLMPAEFMVAAEAEGMLNDIGRWALCTACAEMMSWRRAGGPFLRLAINVSPQQLQGGHFTDTLRRASASSGLPLTHIDIEIPQHGLAWLEERDFDFEGLKATGVGITLDHCSCDPVILGHLGYLPIDRLKIDGTLLAEGVAGPDCDELLRTIRNLSRNLGVSIAASRVETELQLSRVRRAGCDEAQGFLFGGPQPLAQLRQRIAGDQRRAWH